MIRVNLPLTTLSNNVTGAPLGNIAGLLIVIFGSPAGNSCKIVVFSPDYLITFTSTCAINVKHN
jgi:hypothetical protein